MYKSKYKNKCPGKNLPFYALKSKETNNESHFNVQMDESQQSLK